MQCKQVDHITWFPAPDSGHQLVHGKIGDRQHKTELLVGHRGKITKIAVRHPFKLRCLAVSADFGADDAWKLSKPHHHETLRLEHCPIVFGGFGYRCMRSWNMSMSFE